MQEEVKLVAKATGGRDLTRGYTEIACAPPATWSQTRGWVKKTCMNK